MLKCHCCHSDFSGVPNSFGNHVTNIEFFSSPVALNCRKFPKNLGMSRQLWVVAETKFSAGPSCVTGPAELIEMVQYDYGIHGMVWNSPHGFHGLFHGIHMEWDFIKKFTKSNMESMFIP